MKNNGKQQKNIGDMTFECFDGLTEEQRELATGTRQMTIILPLFDFLRITELAKVMGIDVNEGSTTATGLIRDVIHTHLENHEHAELINRLAISSLEHERMRQELAYQLKKPD